MEENQRKIEEQQRKMVRYWYWLYQLGSSELGDLLYLAHWYSGVLSKIPILELEFAIYFISSLFSYK